MSARFASGGVCAAALFLASCTQSEGISSNAEPFADIAEDETVHLLGTEPFWSFEISGEQARYSSPEDDDGTPFTVARFAGNNGLGYSGDLDGLPVQIAVTPGECSDGMSDRSYPFTATVSLGDTNLSGCGYTDSDPFTGEETP